MEANEADVLNGGMDGAKGPVGEGFEEPGPFG